MKKATFQLHTVFQCLLLGLIAQLFLTNDTIAATSQCGDEVVDFTLGEQCDSSGETESCNANCRVSGCGDGIVNTTAGEFCEPGLAPDSCTAQCTPVMCGDGVIQGTEECDDGEGNSDTAPGACRTDCTVARCGDGVIDPGEELDPPVSPSVAVPVDPQTCRYDFSDIGQLYCNHACGNWNGLNGCQVEDADALCKLRTGNPRSTLKDTERGWNVESAKMAPGVCCPPPGAEPGTLGCVALGDMASRGVDLEVSVHDHDLNSTHGTGAVVTVDPLNCTDPR